MSNQALTLGPSVSDFDKIILNWNLTISFKRFINGQKAGRLWKIMLISVDAQWRDNGLFAEKN